MKTVWKYPLKYVDKQIITIPKEAKVLSAINQNEYLMLYVMVNTDCKETSKLNVYILGTGRPISMFEPEEHDVNFVNTVSTCSGSLIWHVFVRKI